MILVVQQTTTEWGRRSRGSPGAAQRNAVPEAFPLPIPQPEARRYEPSRLVHTLKYYEWRRFRNPTTELVLNGEDHPLVTGCVSIAREERTVRSEFRYSLAIAGIPDRGSLREALRTGPDEWAQVAYSGGFNDARFDESFWFYAKVVVNVGLFSELTADVFTRSQPKARFRSMGPLY